MRRRQLIKASAAAVPAVMTLRSGAAAAMASTYHCTARDNKLAQTEFSETADFVLEGADLPHDHWVRVAGRRVTQGQATYYCTLTGNGTGLDAWQCFAEDGTQLVQGDNWPNWLTENYINGNNGDDVALLAFLNFNAHGDDIPFDDGAQIHYYPMIQTVTPVEGGGPSPLTGSCLSSIHPNLLNGNLG
jgi:hypothetical protein